MFGKPMIDLTVDKHPSSSQVSALVTTLDVNFVSRGLLVECVIIVQVAMLTTRRREKRQDLKAQVGMCYISPDYLTVASLPAGTSKVDQCTWGPEQAPSRPVRARAASGAG